MEVIVNKFLECPEYLVVEEKRKQQRRDGTATSSDAQSQAHRVLDIKRWESFSKKGEQLCRKQWKALVK